MSRFLDDRRPNGVADRNGLYRFTSHSETKPTKNQYPLVESIPDTETQGQGQKSIENFFTTNPNAEAPETKYGDQIIIQGRRITFTDSTFSS